MLGGKLLVKLSKTLIRPHAKKAYGPTVELLNHLTLNLFFTNSNFTLNTSFTILNFMSGGLVLMNRFFPHMEDDEV